MTEKELRRMSRKELIEIIAAQKKRELKLQQQLDQAEQLLADRNIKISNAGSIAEAAMALSGVFETAQTAADSYLASLRHANANIEAQIAETEEECARRLEETDRKCAEKLAASDEEIKRRTAAFNRRIREFMNEHPELRGMNQQ